MGWCEPGRVRNGEGVSQEAGSIEKLSTTEPAPLGRAAPTTDTWKSRFGLGELGHLGFSGLG